MYWKHNNRLANDPKKVLPVSTARAHAAIPVRIQCVSRKVYFDDQLIPVLKCFQFHGVYKLFLNLKGQSGSKTSGIWRFTLSESLQVPLN